MSSEAVTAVLRAIDLMNRREVDELGDVCRPDVEFHSSPELPGTQAHYGLDATKAFMDEFLEQWEEYRLEPDEIIERDDRVLVLATAHIRGMASQVSTEQKIGYLFTVRDGKLARTEAFFRIDAARAALEAGE